MSEKQLYRRIQMLGFVLNDVNLYLDTHPLDKAALTYFNKYSELYQEARKEYEEKYGPMCITGLTNAKSWEWVDGPWPWQREEV